MVETTTLRRSGRGTNPPSRFDENLIGRHVLVSQSIIGKIVDIDKNNQCPYKVCLENRGQIVWLGHDAVLDASVEYGEYRDETPHKKKARKKASTNNHGRPIIRNDSEEEKQLDKPHVNGFETASQESNIKDTTFDQDSFLNNQTRLFVDNNRATTEQRVIQGLQHHAAAANDNGGAKKSRPCKPSRNAALETEFHKSHPHEGISKDESVATKHYDRQRDASGREAPKTAPYSPRRAAVEWPAPKHNEASDQFRTCPSVISHEDDAEHDDDESSIDRIEALDRWSLD